MRLSLTALSKHQSNRTHADMRVQMMKGIDKDGATFFQRSDDDNDVPLDHANDMMEGWDRGCRNMYCHWCYQCWQQAAGLLERSLNGNAMHILQVPVVQWLREPCCSLFLHKVPDFHRCCIIAAHVT